MALTGRRIENFDDISLAACSQGLPICVSSTSFQKSSLCWPQQPLTEKVLEFNLINHDSTPQKKIFQKIKIKLNSRTWMTLKSPVVIFQALEPLQPQWPQQPLWPQKIKNCLHFAYWVIFLASGTSPASMISTVSTTSVASMTSTASYHQKCFGTWCFHQP